VSATRLNWLGIAWRAALLGLLVAVVQAVGTAIVTEHTPVWRSLMQDVMIGRDRFRAVDITASGEQRALGDDSRRVTQHMDVRVGWPLRSVAYRRTHVEHVANAVLVADPLWFDASAGIITSVVALPGLLVNAVLYAIPSAALIASYAQARRRPRVAAITG
jgi:hypothetical protein